MKIFKFWSIMMMLVLGTVIAFSSCNKDEGCNCGGDCHGTQCSAPCADDCKCTQNYVVEDVITFDGNKFDIDVVEVKNYSDKVKIEFGNKSSRIYCMIDFYGINIPVGNNITLRRLEVEYEANKEQSGGAYDGTAYADVSRDGDIYTIKVNNQTIIGEDNKTHRVSLSYKGLLW